MQLTRCYMCEAEGTTMEHVPPRALFPEAKDVQGKDYRVELITVPSCPLHNTAKSDDDQFLMVSLAGIIGNNSIGYHHRMTKVDRAIRRSSNRLLDKVLVKRSHSLKIDLNNNRFLEVIWGTPDAQRLHRCFNHIVRGLHFHHFSEPLAGEVRPFLGFLSHSDRSARNFSEFIEHRASLDLAEKTRYGKNPDVFFYSVTEPDQFGLYLFHLCFYGGVNVYAAVIPSHSQRPHDIGFELMNRGIKTFLKVGDKSYEIN